MQRVVITGIGTISPIGNSVDQFWENIKANKTGISPLEMFDEDFDSDVKVAAQVKDFNPKDTMKRKEYSRMDRYSQFGVAASVEALEKSGVNEELIRLSIGLESVKDILQDLDQAISSAAGVDAQLVDTEESVTNWLTHSPFDRSEGVRAKVIATDFDAGKVANVKKSGYQVITLDEIAATDIVDVIWTDKTIDEQTLKQFSAKQGKIVWIESEPTGDILSSFVEDSDIITFFNKDLVEEITKAKTQF